MKLVMMLVLVVLTASLARADETVERTILATSKEENPAEARKDIMDQITTKMTEDLTRELLGEEHFLKNHAVILAKIAKSSGKFLPLSKPGNLEKIPEGYKMSVTLTANISTLRQMLHDQGLLNENNAASLLLPLVAFRDEIHGASDRWWLPNERVSSPLLRTMGREFETALRGGFRKNSFYVIQPTILHLSPSVPKALTVENLGPEETQLLADYFSAPLYLQGTVSVRPPEKSKPLQIEVKIGVLQASNNRTIADVARSYPLDGSTDLSILKKWKEVVEPLAADLAAQVFEAGQKGAIGSSQIRLSVEPRPTLPVIETLKEKLRSSNLGLRDIHERLISTKAVVFEIQSPLSAPELATKLNGFEFQGQKLTATADGQEVKLRGLEVAK